LLNGLLLIGLAGLLALYALVVYAGGAGDAPPPHVYSPEQSAFLTYNRGRVISQDAPVLNVVLPSSEMVPAELTELETRVEALLDARYEEHEGVSVTVYDLDFEGEYHLSYPGPLTTTIELFFPFPSNLETLHDVRFLVDGEEPAGARYALEGIRWLTQMSAGQEHTVVIGYRADGVDRFAYALNRDRRAELLDVEIVVRGLTGSEAMASSLPPTEHVQEEGGERITWQYANLIPSRDIQLQLPARLGFAQRVEQLEDDFQALATLAPLLVGLFLAALAGTFYFAGIPLSLPGYLLVGWGMALFYPLLTFLSGLMDLLPAAGISFTFVSALLLGFLALVAGWRGTAWRAGLLLVIFLGFLSLGMLTPWWRLLLTFGGLLLVGLFMLHYARRRRDESLSDRGATVGSEPEDGSDGTVVEQPPAVEEPPVVAGRHCPRCGHELAPGHAFCAGCGYDVRPFRRCAACEHEQFVLPGLEPAHCVRCGAQLATKSNVR
jgi:hypothetical protein